MGLLVEESKKRMVGEDRESNRDPLYKAGSCGGEHNGIRISVHLLAGY